MAGKISSGARENFIGCPGKISSPVLSLFCSVLGKFHRVPGENFIGWPGKFHRVPGKISSGPSLGASLGTLVYTLFKNMCQSAHFRHKSVIYAFFDTWKLVFLICWRQMWHTSHYLYQGLKKRCCCNQGGVLHSATAYKEPAIKTT